MYGGTSVRWCGQTHTRFISCLQGDNYKQSFMLKSPLCVQNSQLLHTLPFHNKTSNLEGLKLIVVFDLRFVTKKNTTASRTCDLINTSHVKKAPSPITLPPALAVYIAQCLIKTLTGVIMHYSLFSQEGHHAAWYDSKQEMALFVVDPDVCVCRLTGDNMRHCEKQYLCHMYTVKTTWNCTGWIHATVDLRSCAMCPLQERVGGCVVLLLAFYHIQRRNIYMCVCRVPFFPSTTAVLVPHAVLVNQNFVFGWHVRSRWLGIHKQIEAVIILRGFQHTVKWRQT